MAIAKIIIDNTTNIDLTQDTVTEADVLNQKTFHKNDGTTGTGNASYVTYYTSSSTPTSSQGSNGDVWLVTAS